MEAPALEDGGQLRDDGLVGVDPEQPRPALLREEDELLLERVVGGAVPRQHGGLGFCSTYPRASWLEDPSCSLAAKSSASSDAT